MDDFIKDAKEELKRADHLIYVSLKYTRTVDIIKHIIERFINCIDFIYSGLLARAEEEGKIEEVPKAPAAKCNLIKKLYKDDEFMENYAEFYLMMRQISRAEFERDLEFRRHVTMTAHLTTGEDIEINIDIITDYFKKMKDFLQTIEERYA